MDGSPDPTVGACAVARTTWFFDTEAIRDDVSKALTPGRTAVSVALLLNKVSFAETVLQLRVFQEEILFNDEKILFE